jgi:predicted ArsR family transcriptional regulator
MKPPASYRLQTMSPPLRGILDRVQMEPISAAEIAADLGAPAESVRHHLRKMHQMAMVERAGRTRRRGPVEYLYSRDASRVIVGPGEFAGISTGFLDRVHAQLLRTMFRDAKDALVAKTFARRDESALIRFPISLDDQGWQEALALHDRLLDSVVEICEQAKGRIASDKAERIPAGVAILLFEAPSPWPPPFDGARPYGGPTRRLSKRNRVDAIASLGDPLRMKITDALNLGPASAEELATRLGVSTEAVRCELNRLRAVDAVKVHSIHLSRGLRQHVYLSESRNLTFNREDVATYTGERLDGFCRETAVAIFSEALAATRAGAFHARDDFCMARIATTFDAQGFRETSDLMEDALERLFSLREECLERLSAGDRPQRPVFSDLLLFERP